MSSAGTARLVRESHDRPWRRKVKNRFDTTSFITKFFVRYSL